MSGAHAAGSELEAAFERLHAWCRERGYSGHDPFDALNSRLFQATPLRHSRVARLAWTQLFKRSPINLRGLAGVPTEKNAKGHALFALAALARVRHEQSALTEAEARALLDELLAARLDNLSGAAWGYNFDWQGRAFYAPRGTATIVPTAFAARALVEAYEVFKDDSYLRVARSVCDFILHDLNRSAEALDETCWSYSPLDHTRVFNASLLAAETLASVSALTGEKDLCEQALSGARYVVRRQRADGSWAYGAEGFQSWADNFHTAFVLTSLARIMRACARARDELLEATRRGYAFWTENFFLADGWPKYYHDRLYPVDAHSAGAAVVALLEMALIDEAAPALASTVALWAVRHLQDRRGFFYYQLRRFHTVRTPYMRWSQAWMMYALARLLEKSGRKSVVSGQ
ncbi:MAG: hypothetical protein JO360_18920 [Acidobacteria bacterium]|nr:hypothetical protein [Acidobacteriota bacterium]